MVHCVFLCPRSYLQEARGFMWQFYIGVDSVGAGRIMEARTVALSVVISRE